MSNIQITTISSVKFWKHECDCGASYPDVTCSAISGGHNFLQKIHKHYFRCKKCGSSFVDIAKYYDLNKQVEISRERLR